MSTSRHLQAWLGPIGAALLLSAGAATADSITTGADFDRWNYPFNSAPGIRNLASTFGSLGDAEFDDRDAQVIVGFDTDAAGIPSGQGAGAYQIDSVTVTATHFVGDFQYDPTYDGYQTYLDPSDGDYVADADAGRPIELHGLGFRSGYFSLELPPVIPGPPGYAEDETYAFADPTLPGVRNAFAANSAGVDISNNVSGGFESDPWAIGQVDGLTPGADVPEGDPGNSAGATFSFEVDLSDPAVVAYIANGLDSGLLGFAITSLHTTTREGGVTPNFYTRDNFDPAAIAPTVSITYSLVPEPGSALLGLSALVGLAFFVRRTERA